MAIVRTEISGNGWLLYNGSASRRIRASGQTVTGGTYTLYDPTGTQVYTVSIPSGGIVTVNLSGLTSLDIGGGYIENWTPTVAAGTCLETYCSAVLLSLNLSCPVSNVGILDRYPSLTIYPNGQTDWLPQIDQAWQVVSQRLIARSRIGSDVAALRNPDALYECTIELALCYVFQALSTFNDSGYAVRAKEHKAQHDSAWGMLDLEYALDTDNALSTNEVPNPAPSFPPPGPLAKRG